MCVLFSESPGRFIVTIAPENRAAFEALFAGLPLGKIGTVTGEKGNLLSGLRESP